MTIGGLRCRCGKTWFATEADAEEYQREAFPDQYPHTRRYQCWAGAWHWTSLMPCPGCGVMFHWRQEASECEACRKKAARAAAAAQKLEKIRDRQAAEAERKVAKGHANPHTEPKPITTPIRAIQATPAEALRALRLAHGND